MPAISDHQRRDKRPAGRLCLEKLTPWLISFGVHVVILLVVMSAAAIVSERHGPQEAIVPEAAWMPPAEDRVNFEPLPTPVAAGTMVLTLPSPPQDTPPADRATDASEAPAPARRTLFSPAGAGRMSARAWTTLLTPSGFNIESRCRIAGDSN